MHKHTLPSKHQTLPEAQAIVGSVLDLKTAISDHHKCSQDKEQIKEGLVP